MKLLVCLCSSALTPQIGGVRGGTIIKELTALLASLRKVLKSTQNRGLLAGAAQGEPQVSYGAPPKG
jgi:hypothetical protein